MKTDEKGARYAETFKEQFTLRGIIIGCIGAAVLTMSSMYTALKMGALPWPIIFVALASMFFLRLLGRGKHKTNLNEINVTHTVMSAGAMTAGGLSFTLPGLFMLDPTSNVSFGKILVIVLGGTILGLIFTALIRKYFIVTNPLPFPMGQAAAETVIVGDEGGRKSGILFGSMGISGLFTVLRDALGKIPVIAPTSVAAGKAAWTTAYGSTFGLYLSPMLVAVGYIIGPVAIGVWFLGALIGDPGILIAGNKLGFWDAATAAGIKSSLGIGMMVGTGIGIILKGILPKAKEIFGPMFSSKYAKDGLIDLRWAPIAMVVLAVVFSTVCKMGVVASIVTILGVWLATSMSAQCVGQSGVNPMEIFGIIVLLAVKALTGGTGGSGGQMALFFVAAVVAIACGLAGDVMNDFKAGSILHSDPKAQWIGECIGGMVGVLVSVGVFYVILKAYGPKAFGDITLFPAPQAGAVAAMVGGVANVPVFWVGIVIAVILYFVNFPVMTLGLGIYLPFYMSAAAFIGGALKFIVEKAAPEYDKGGTGNIIASGVLGGEAVVGVIIALVQAIPAMVQM